MGRLGTWSELAAACGSVTTTTTLPGKTLMETEAALTLYLVAISCLDHSYATRHAGLQVMAY